MAVETLARPPTFKPRKRVRRTATSVLTGYFDPRPHRDVLTSLLNGVAPYTPLGPDEDEIRRQRKRDKKAREKEQRRALQEATGEGIGVQTEALPHASTSSAYWNARPAIHIATLQRSRSETPPPLPAYLSALPSTPASTPSPSESSSTSRTSSKRPRTPDDDEDLVRVIHRPPPPRKPRPAVRKGWKGWVEGSPPPSEKLINLDAVPILQERRTRSGKNFDAIGVGKEGWV
ncbi:hypothetical protein MIND_00148300 [Mycena indigotica]|uniref:Uncharacterized protein n=1 Tax=Mycena indigotica TaxID=2126181 RepID=A0A8H6TFA2_9AGAR|nr:uncharacterized protein MIND_00148300 [Mycena indigotica]KAF7316296.1 hypothetical protein MIND_00148300 [Mycena indigotica]